jgi:hypothetical protein
MAIQPLSTAPRDLGSVELTLLSSGTPTPLQAAQPYFVYARIKAAATIPPAQQIPLLQSAVLVAPDSMIDRLRLQIFEASVAAGKYDLANTAIQPVLASQPWVRSIPAASDTDSEDAEMNEADTTDTVAQDATAQAASVESHSLSAALGTDEQKVAFEVKLAEMDEHLGKIDLAVQDLQVARALTPDAAQQKTLDARLSTLQATSAREAKNAKRRPTVKDELQQTVVVRPRLTASAPAEVAP